MDLSRSLAPDRIVTTDEVLSEYLAFFAGARPSIRAEAGKNVAELMKSLTVLVFPQSRDCFLAGLELYRARPDKGYSLVDCISMQTMRREGLTEVLTNDRHFEQEGCRWPVVLGNHDDPLLAARTRRRQRGGHRRRCRP